MPTIQQLVRLSRLKINKKTNTKERVELNVNLYI